MAHPILPPSIKMLQMGRKARVGGRDAIKDTLGQIMPLKNDIGNLPL